MIKSALVTVYVNDLDAAVAFYTKTLGCTLRFQAGSEWAQVEAGSGFSIGLHPRSDKGPEPGTRGSMSIGFYTKDPIEKAVESLHAKGVQFRGPIVDDDPVKLAFFGDPDGNELYLCEYSEK